MAIGLYDPAFEHDACGIGLVADLHGRPSHGLVGQGADRPRAPGPPRAPPAPRPPPATGPGSWSRCPHRFLAGAAEAPGSTCPRRAPTPSGMAFLPTDADDAAKAEDRWSRRSPPRRACACSGWRDVPVEHRRPGRDGPAGHARGCAGVRGPGAGRAGRTGAPTPWRSTGWPSCLRKRVEHEVDGALLRLAVGPHPRLQGHAHLPPAAPVLPRPVRRPRSTAGLALVHSRFSTNTFPSWPLAHPYRYLAHNGEINTLAGNRNWMRAREALLASRPHPRRPRAALPDLHPEGSDSATFDEVLELLHLGGRSPAPRRAHDDPRGVGEPHHHGPGPAGLLPLPRLAHGALGRPGRRGLHRRHGGRRRARPQRPAPGPLLGHRRRPGGAGLARSGVLDIDPAKVVRKGRLQPGPMFLVDTAQGRIVDDDEIKAAAGRRAPLRRSGWPRTRSAWTSCRRGPCSPPSTPSVVTHQRLFGYTNEELRIILAPMARTGAEPLGSMGSRRRHRRALGPPAPALRLLHPALRPGDQPAPRRHPRGAGHLAGRHASGPRATCSTPTPGSCRQIILPYPVIDSDDLAKLHVRQRARRDARASRPSPSTGCSRWPRRRGRAPDAGAAGPWPGHRGRPPPGVASAIADGANIIVLSDRNSTADLAPIPSLLLTAAVHHHLVREKTRTQVGLVVETGDAREVHHMALLIGYGAAAVNPYLAFETIDDMIAAGPARGGLAPPGPAQLHQGGLQGRHQDHVQDGRLDGGLLHRGPDLRGRRARPRRGRRVLHRHGQPHRRRGPRRAGRRGGRPPPPGPPRAARPSGPTASSRSAASTSGGAKGEHPPLQPEDRLQAPARHPGQALRHLQGVHQRWSTTSPTNLATLRGLLRAARRACCRPGPDRRGRAGRPTS